MYVHSKSIFRSHLQEDWLRSSSSCVCGVYSTSTSDIRFRHQWTENMLSVQCEPPPCLNLKSTSRIVKRALRGGGNKCVLFWGVPFHSDFPLRKDLVMISPRHQDMWFWTLDDTDLPVEIFLTSCSAPKEIFNARMWFLHLIHDFFPLGVYLLDGPKRLCDETTTIR